MRVLLRSVIILIGVAVTAVLAHLALIEVGREVVVLRTVNESGETKSMRLWAVDHDGAVWLHSAGEHWHKMFEGDPIVELERHGVAARYKAVAVPGPHPEIDQALREKYGIADRWVRFISPDDDGVLVVRLEKIESSAVDSKPE